jgi:hypothetical protein
MGGRVGKHRASACVMINLLKNRKKEKEKEKEKKKRNLFHESWC